MIVDVSKKILIVGLGLLGGSYAKALKKQGCAVEAVTRSQDSIDYALEQGIIDGGAAFADQLVEQAMNLGADMELETVVRVERKDIGFQIHTEEVTGVKGCVVYDLQAMLRPDVEFIAAHPMAGRERGGFTASTDSLYTGAFELE